MADFDPATVGAEDFARLVASLEETQLVATLRGVGTARVLERVFVQMCERFRPEHAAGVDATAQFLIRDGDEEHPWAVAIREGRCAARGERAAGPRVTLVADLASFVKLVTGNAEGATLFMTGRLRVAGDLVFSLRLLSFFDRPKPA
jgi:putative sterol carrier protein